MAPRRFVPAVMLSGLILSCVSCGGPVQSSDLPGTDTSVGTECVSSSQCDDGQPCTTDRCNRGWCSNVPMDCDDGDDCTEDSCSEGKCRNLKIPGCCEIDADCDDGDPCTKDDSCSMMKRCVIKPPISNCCRSDADCVDSDPCTRDVCQINLLCNHIWEKKAGVCCGEDRDCSDSDSCTRDHCVLYEGQHGRCDYETICCDDDSECTDGETTCLEGVCEVPEGGLGKECAYRWIPDCCMEAADCQEYDCESSSCSGNKCQREWIPGCCTSDLECPHSRGCLMCNNGSNPTGACILKNETDCCDTTVFSADFASVDGWEFQKPSDYMTDATGWADLTWAQVGPACNVQNSIGFLDPATCSSRVDDLRAGARAVSPSIALMTTNNPGLSFRLWKWTDDIDRGKDVFRVLVKSGTGTLTEVFSTASQTPFVTGTNRENTVFVTIPSTGTISLSRWASQNIQLVFEYDSISKVYVDSYGVFVDDVKVTGTCD